MQDICATAPKQSEILPEASKSKVDAGPGFWEITCGNRANIFDFGSPVVALVGATLTGLPAESTRKQISDHLLRFSQGRPENVYTNIRGLL